MKVFLGIDVKSLGSVLKVYRKSNKLTQEKVGEYLGLDRSTYAKYEKSRKPDLEVLLKLSVLYQISLDDFFGSFFKNTDDADTAPVAVVSSPDTNETPIEITKDEKRLLTIYRDSIRKTEIMKAAEDIYQYDKNIVDEMQNF